MSRFTCLAFCVLQAVIFVHATGTYTVVGPGTIRSNFKYNVAVSVHKADGPSKIKVGITGPSYNETKTVDVEPMSTQNVQFDVPQLKPGDYNLTAAGLSGVVFENSTSLNLADYKPSTFIQTDKATYKPGDLVNFRVLFLDENIRPAKIDKPINIIINDGAQNRIKQWTDVKLTKGVYTGKFQLSEQPVLGDWKIEVNVGGENPLEKNFEIAKYVLPKFEVFVETAKDVAIPDGVIKVTVRSKYTYGKSVKGKATISVKPAYSYYGTASGELEAEKTIDVDGKGHVEFDLTKDLRINNDHYAPPLKILAVMEEELTGNKQNATAGVNLHRDRFRIEGIDTPYNYHPGKPVIFKVVVKNLDGSPVLDTKNPVMLSIDAPRNYIHNWGSVPLPAEAQTTPEPEEKSIELKSFLNENGIATFEFTIPEDSKHNYYSVKSRYLGTQAYLSSISKFTPSQEKEELLKLVVNTEKPRLGKDISVEVRSSESIPYFVYTIVARGNIIKSAHIEVPEGRKTHTIKFTPTFDMVPKASFFVHYVFNNDLRFEETSINFEKEFENSIDISSQAQAKPGEDVKLKIKTDPDSLVGLLGVDQSVLLLKSGNDITKDQVFGSLDNYDTQTPYQRGYGRYPGQSSGLVTLTNANYPYNEGRRLIWDDLVLRGASVPIMLNSPIPGMSGMPGMLGVPARPPLRKAYAQSSAAVKIRKQFSEIWIYDQLNADDQGISLSKKIPDTITSWVITGFSMNEKSGFALTDNPTKIQVFQPFFVSTNLPYSVKRGEVIAIPVIIFNYMDKTLDAEVTMDNTDKEFEFTEATNEVEENPSDEVQRVKRVTIPSNSGKSVSFMIRPKKVGQTTLKITATTPLAGDAIHQKLKVEPEGVTQYVNRAFFLNLADNGEHTEKINIEIPADAVEDSEYIELSAVGDLLGPTIQNLHKLVRMPYGCGEQNMVNFVPNILVLKYLEATKQSSPQITEKAVKYLEVGYQRELTYKHDDGSYSAFGKSDKSGSTWLTAYVVRSFHQAAPYTEIDPKVIVDGLDFLASKQAENGSFPEYGKLFDSAHQNELGLTAFTLLAFLENVEHIEKYKQNIDKAMAYLQENVDKSDDQYALSIAASALQQAKHPLAEKVLAKLQSVSKQDTDRKWWSKEIEKPKEENYWYHPHSNDVEITSYVLQALLEKETAETVLPIVRWLISQRNSNGGFASTQDTVVGLQALIKFAEKINSGTGDMTIDFVSNGGAENKGSVKVDKSNSLLLQSHVLPKTTRQVEFTAKGKGSAMLQVAYSYNLAEKDKKPSFSVKTNVKDNTPPSLLVLDICAEYVPLEGTDSNKDSNMAVLEVALPSGYTADSESFQKIEAVDRVKRTETKNSDSTVIVYFDSLTPKDVKCIPIEATKTHAVAKHKPAAVNIYDYYDTERKATEYYEVKSSLCDICEGDDCGAGCKKN